MPSYEELMRKRYDNDKCSQAFSELVKNPKNSEKISVAIETALPVLGCVLHSNFKRVVPGSEEYDEILSSVPFSLFMYLSSDRFYKRFYNSENSHFSFLFGIFRYEVLNTLKKVRRFSMDDIDVDGFHNVELESFSGFTEFKIFFNELPKNFFDKVEKKIRFDGVKRDVTLFIVKNFKEQRVPPVCVIKQWWKLEKEEIDFLVKYVCTVIKHTLYEMKEEMGNFQYIFNSESDLLKRNTYDMTYN